MMTILSEKVLQFVGNLVQVGDWEQCHRPCGVFWCWFEGRVAFVQNCDGSCFARLSQNRCWRKFCLVQRSGNSCYQTEHTVGCWGQPCLKFLIWVAKQFLLHDSLRFMIGQLWFYIVDKLSRHFFRAFLKLWLMNLLYWVIGLGG